MNTVVQDKEVFGRITTRSAPSTRALRDIDPSDPFSLHGDRVPDLAEFSLFFFQWHPQRHYYSPVGHPEDLLDERTLLIEFLGFLWTNFRLLEAHR